MISDRLATHLAKEMGLESTDPSTAGRLMKITEAVDSAWVIILEDVADEIEMAMHPSEGVLEVLEYLRTPEAHDS